MCRSSTVFHSNCGHITRRRTLCSLRTCMTPESVGPLPVIFRLDGICLTCQSKPSNPSIPQPLIAARHRFFYRRGARQEVVRYRRNLDSARFFASSPPPPPPGYPVIYSLDHPRIPGATLLTPVGLEELPQDSRDCTVCSRPLRNQSLQERTTKSPSEFGSEFPVRLPCHEDHVFGHICIKRWLEDKPTCPICRSGFNINRTPRMCEQPLTFSFFDGEALPANWDHPMLADMESVEADGDVDPTPDEFEILEPSRGVRRFYAA